MDISLLPKELRAKEGTEQKKKTSHDEELVLTDPDKEKLDKKETAVKTQKLGNPVIKRLKELFSRRQEDDGDFLTTDSKITAKKEEITLVTPPKEPARITPLGPLEPAKSVLISEPPVEHQSKNEKISLTPDSLLNKKIENDKTSKDSWWRRLFGKRRVTTSVDKNTEKLAAKPKEIKINEPSVTKPSLVPPVSNHEDKNKTERLHLPEKVDHPDFGSLEVDLTKQLLIVYYPELYSKIKKSLVILVVYVVAVAAVYFGLIYYQSYLSGQSQETDAKITQFNQKLQDYQTQKDKIVALDKQLTSLGQIVSNHYYWSGLFQFLEAQTVPEVYYKNLTVDGAGRVILSVVAKDYLAAAKQIAVFEEATDQISQVTFNTASMKTIVLDSPDNKKINEPEEEITEVLFNLELNLKPDFFLKP
ncbi:MAG: hypothetical protein WC480_03595 [Patescibacteria group bacterium]